MLKYTGGGYGGWLPNIPARDLTDEEVKVFGEIALLKTGLYAKPGTVKLQPKAHPQGIIDLKDGVDDAEATLAGQTLAAAKEQKK